MIVDLSKIPTPQLREMINILEYGATATAETDKTIRQLQAENEKLKKMNDRRYAVESAGLEWDDEYLSLSDKSFEFFLEKLKSVHEAAASSGIMKVPAIFSSNPSNIDIIREGFAEHRRGNESTQNQDL